MPYIMRPAEIKEDHNIFEAFPVRVGSSFSIKIPKNLVQTLELKVNDYLIVAIRKASLDEIKKEFGDVYGHKKRKYPEKPKPIKRERVVCPVCGKPGYIRVRKDKRMKHGFAMYVIHTKADGFEDRKTHYVRMHQHRKFIEEHWDKVVEKMGRK